MEKSHFYTKGIKEEILTRINQVHSITLFCPLEDACVRGLKDTFEVMLDGYKTDENTWSDVPAIDALNAFIITASFQQSMGIDVDKDIIGVIVSSLKMFNRLKIITFKFTDDPDIMDTYKKLLKNDKNDIKKYFYKIDILEMNLGDMFSQSIIDMLNKVFIWNELIPNSYLDRRFVLEFRYEDYTSFMNMFIENNKEDLDALDKNICDYFRNFPKLVEEQKPMIRLITNYKEMI